MKDLLVYTAMRLGMFLGAFGIIFGVWAALADAVPLIWVIVLAFVVSGFTSYFLLDRQRENLAQRVEVRAGRMTERYEAARAKEDVD